MGQSQLEGGGVPLHIFVYFGFLPTTRLGPPQIYFCPLSPQRSEFTKFRVFWGLLPKLCQESDKKAWGGVGWGSEIGFLLSGMTHDVEWTWGALAH